MKGSLNYIKEDLMSHFSVHVRIFVGFIILVALFSGCVTTIPFQKLTPDKYQTTHQTEFVLVTHPPIKYYWEIRGEYDTFQREIQRDKIKTMPIQWQKPQKEELNIVEPYFAQFQDPTPITQKIYFQTFQRGLAEHNFLQLKPYSGKVTVNNFEQKKRSVEFLSYDIPVGEEETPPEWFLVFEVNDLGLIKRGMTARGRRGLADVLKDLTTTALTKKTWAAWFSGRLWIVDANSHKILWGGAYAKGIVEIEGKLEELVEANAFPKAFVEAIAQAAAKDAVSLIKNQDIGELDETTAKYMLKAEELGPFIDALFK
jgi:hypothetical protein